jgi:hypothetical protein
LYANEITNCGDLTDEQWVQLQLHLLLQKLVTAHPRHDYRPILNEAVMLEFRQMAAGY